MRRTQARSMGHSSKPTLRVGTDQRTAAVYHSTTSLPKDGSDEQVYAPRIAVHCKNPRQLSQALPLMTFLLSLCRIFPQLKSFLR